MIFHLIKKDFLLVKASIPFMILVSFIIPLFIASKLGAVLGPLTAFVTFYIEAMFIQFLTYNCLMTEESASRKGQSLLCATPYTRSLFVQGKYAFNLILFVYCIIVFIIETILFPQIMDSISITAICLVFLAMAILLGVEIPLELKFGYDKIKYFFILAIVISPYLVPYISKIMLERNISFRTFFTLPVAAQIAIPLTAALLIAFLSINLSMKLYSRKEL